MESKTIWVFIRKNDSGIASIKTYGSITKMHESEVVKIGNDVKSITSVRNMLKSGKYVDDKYHIEKQEIIRSKSKS